MHTYVLLLYALANLVRSSSQAKLSCWLFRMAMICKEDAKNLKQLLDTTSCGDAILADLAHGVRCICASSGVALHVQIGDYLLEG